MVDYAGAPVTICFNAQYVLDFLGVVETDSVSLEFKDEMSQAVMKPIGAEGLRIHLRHHADAGLIALSRCLNQKSTTTTSSSRKVKTPR